MASKKTNTTLSREELKARVAKEFARITGTTLWTSKDGKKFRYYVDTRNLFGTTIKCNVWYNPIACKVEKKFDDEQSIASVAKLAELVRKIAKELQDTGKCTIKPIAKVAKVEEEDADALF